MSKFKVGDRVKLVKDGHSTTGAVGKFATIESWGTKLIDDGQYLLNIDGPIDYQTLAVTPNYTRATPDCFELIQPLTIEAGKYYRTRDGRNVGPMRDYNGIDGYPWDGCGTGQFYNKVGKADDGSEYDLIAEWVDEPVAEQQEVEQPQAQKLTSADGSFGLDITNGVLTMNVANLGTVTAPTVVKGQLVKTPRGYGYELARFGQWSWVDTGNSQPVIITTSKLAAVAA